MKTILKIIALFFLLILHGCAYRYYMGMHGPSIKSYPEIHEDIKEDNECLSCHHPDNAQGPVTSHPDFKGCYKCHSD